MKEIVVISGKGGTGKTSVTGALACLAGSKAIVADCDVDAADMHLLLKPDFGDKHAFYSGKIASINSSLCIGCGKCKAVCHFEAVLSNESVCQINKMNCEGCGYCAEVCTQQAIAMNDCHTGNTYTSTTRIHTRLVHAELCTGAENSGKLVTKVREQAKILAQDLVTPYVIVDGSPGIGCPVIASVTGASYVVFVTEPTITGLHDLKRVYDLIQRMGLKCGCVINKADLNDQITLVIKDFIKDKGIDFLGELPYSDLFSKAIVASRSIVEIDQDGEIKKRLNKCWEFIQHKIS